MQLTGSSNPVTNQLIHMYSISCIVVQVKGIIASCGTYYMLITAVVNVAMCCAYSFNSSFTAKTENTHIVLCTVSLTC